MRADVELTPGEKSALSRLTCEEREAVIDQMLERIREDIEWGLSLDLAKQAAAATPTIISSAEVPRPVAATPPPIPSAGRYRWPTALQAKRAR
jgi:hypothetical protein